MDQKQHQQAIAMTEDIMRIYYCNRDIYGVLDHMAPEASWIGPGEREKKYTLEEIRDYFIQGKDEIPSCEVSQPDLRAVDLGEDICLVTGSMTIRTTPESKLLLEVDQRVSFTYRLSGGVLQVVHMHISNPYGEMNREEFFPHNIGSQSFGYLQRLLREKTDVIDMIAGNINGGLKGSNDDDTFSYFYVNEGLPRMLGYTYDEFMEKTGGTAVGAVYPSDLAAALEDCRKCFAKGPVYATEYRMEKKDGSLIWVLDTGRKAPDSEGITRINSIVTDITPLKKALLDLEVERGRYRIALENITGIMCEYDVSGDLFSVYQKSENDRGGVRKMEFSRFSQEISSGVLINQEDGEAFLDLCFGRNPGPIEIRARFFRAEGPWRWYQFSSSIISDNNGTPIHSIGILKDTTEEKQKNLELQDLARRDGLTRLLNQTAAREAVQDYLAAGGGQESRRGALLMLDLDRFKEINDSYGHLYGNDILVQTAYILEETVGGRGFVGRIGGDEFIVLIREAEYGDIVCLAEEIIRKVGEIGSDTGAAVSCSVGIACRSEGEESFSQFFGRADKALYRAKANGRNRWSMDGEEPCDGWR